MLARNNHVIRGETARQGDRGLSSVLPATPCFFPSVSSVKTNLAPIEYVRALRALGAEAFLVSAYDISRGRAKERYEIATALADFKKAGHSLLVDSGNYESYWKADRRWTPSRFHTAVLAAAPHDSLVFCHDDQSPPTDSSKIVDGVVRATERDQSALPNLRLQPIVHAPSALLPEVCAEVATKLKPDLLAIPERLLGDGVLERAKTVCAIRQKLDERVKPRQPLHLLGTGNPRSLFIFAACGADSFDGLEWCQTVVDHQEGTLHHFQHYDFFAWQTPFADLNGVSYIAKVLAHNLAFYADWMEQLRQAKATGSLSAMAREILPVEVTRELVAKLPEIFKA